MEFEDTYLEAREVRDQCCAAISMQQLQQSCNRAATEAREVRDQCCAAISMQQLQQSCNRAATEAREVRDQSCAAWINVRGHVYTVACLVE